MKKTIVCAVAMAGLTAFADASRAVVTMVDGSNVKGGSLIDKIEGDAIFGDDVSVPVELLKFIETVGTNGAAKLASPSILSMREPPFTLDPSTIVTTARDASANAVNPAIATAHTIVFFILLPPIRCYLSQEHTRTVQSVFVITTSS